MQIKLCNIFFYRVSNAYKDGLKMNGNVKVDVFGPERDPKTDGNSLPLKMYFSLIRYLQSSDVNNKVDLNFVDTTKTEINSYPAAKSMIQKGAKAPLIAINGIIKYSGSIPYEQVYQDIKRIVSAK
jgi:hypothetical protein